MGSLYYHNGYAEQLKVLESQLNKNSITGVIQNPYNYTIGGIMMRAEFYDKEDGHLVGLRDFYEVSKDELKPNEKSSFKIYEHAGETKEFPKTDFIVKAEGIDYTNMVDTSFEELIGNINDLGRALESLPDEVNVDITADHPRLGVVGIALSPDLAKEIGSNETKGLLITSIDKDSPAEKSGLRGGFTTIMYEGEEVTIGGDIIQKIDNKEVSSAEDIRAILSQKHLGDKVNLTISRDNAIRQLDVTLEEMLPLSKTMINSSKFTENTNTDFPKTRALCDTVTNQSGRDLCETLLN